MSRIISSEAFQLDQLRPSGSRQELITNTDNNNNNNNRSPSVDSAAWHTLNYYEHHYRNKRRSNNNNNQNEASEADSDATASPTFVATSSPLRSVVARRAANMSGSISGNNGGGGGGSAQKPIDLYSIPVFLLELAALLALAYACYYVHYEYKAQPYVTGLYCDDSALRQRYVESAFTRQFARARNELAVVAILFAFPIVLMVFCELVNSMFGALKFRQTRALCKCCKLHSITRRTVRFVGAYALGMLIVIVCVDSLAMLSGRLRPYFAQECPAAYAKCQQQLPSSLLPPELIEGASSALPAPSSQAPPSPPLSPPIGSQSGAPAGVVDAPATIAAERHRRAAAAAATSQGSGVTKQARQGAFFLLERQWVDLSDKKLDVLCTGASELSPAVSTFASILQQPQQQQDDEPAFRFAQLSRSWPSLPAAVFTYACAFVAVYLCYVGTARPFRMLTCVLATLLLLAATTFNMQLIKEHYHHSDDVIAGAAVAAASVAFVVCVYLNRFRDGHFYERQKLPKYYSSSMTAAAANTSVSELGGSRVFQQDPYGAYNGPMTANGANDSLTMQQQYNLDKVEETSLANGVAGGGGGNNDLAMRYFQIPRANYRAGSRPNSHMR